MPAGLQVFDATGALVFDTSTQVVKHLGKLTATIGQGQSYASGNVVDALFTEGKPFYYIIMDTKYQLTYYAPVVTISGTTLTWYISPEYVYALEDVSATIIYGIY